MSDFDCGGYALMAEMKREEQLAVERASGPWLRFLHILSTVFMVIFFGGALLSFAASAIYAVVGFLR